MNASLKSLSLFSCAVIPTLGMIGEVTQMAANDETPRIFEFVEAPAFSRYRDHYLNDEEFSVLQWALAANPEAGDLIPGAGGVRKLRWKDARRKKGKRGGLRVIYYCFFTDEELWLMTLYDKDEAADLSKSEKDQLRRALEAERDARKDNVKR